MEMTYSEYDRLAETLYRIQNPNPHWFPDKSDVEQKIDSSQIDDVLFLFWISLTAEPGSSGEDKIKLQTVLRKLYESVVLVDDAE